MAASALTLALAGTSFGTAKAAEPVNTGVDETIYQAPEQAPEDEIILYAREADYRGTSFTNGEYHNSFSISNTADDYSVRYNFKNNGSNTFDYKIFRPDGKIFASGTLASGENDTVTIEKKLPLYAKREMYILRNYKKWWVRIL
ncbi:MULTISPECIES: hypothetical protein [Lysinibacillus]|uniref:hypothetical protein n=1 Tax=Lysinibacillus TaxID=400634 RepID=UPI00083CA021|nr:hypothetical protein [Lysinibacillus xylanilyticus]